jgi:hypothetical protein
MYKEQWGGGGNPPKMAMTIIRDSSANKLFRYPSIFGAAP